MPSSIQSSLLWPAIRLGRLASALALGTSTLGALALTLPASAQVTQYSTHPSFDATTSGVTTFDFNGYAPANGAMSYFSGLTVQGVTFTDPGGQGVDVFDPGFAGGAFGDPFNGRQYLNFNGYGGGLMVALPAGTTAFGASFAISGASSSATITATVNGTAFTFQAPGSLSNSSVFAGFTSSVPITSLSFSGVQTADLDYVSYGANGPAAVPEASTTVSFGLLLALGMGGVVIAARKKKAAASA